MVHQGQPQAWQVAVRTAAQAPHLVLGQEELAFVLVVPAQPGRIQADDVDVEREPRQPQCLAVAEIRMKTGVWQERLTAERPSHAR